MKYDHQSVNEILRARDHLRFKELVAHLYYTGYTRFLEEAPFKYHQREQNTRTMIVVPWPHSGNYAINIQDVQTYKDHDFRGIEFARLQRPASLHDDFIIRITGSWLKSIEELIARGSMRHGYVVISKRLVEGAWA